MTLKTAAGNVVQPGDFAAVRTAGDTGRLIRIGEFLNGDGFRDYEHAIFYAGGPDDLILEAEAAGALLHPFAKNPADVLWSSDNPALALDATHRQFAMQVAEQYKGVPYGWLDYAVLAAHRLHIPAPGLKAFIASTKSEICSQLVDTCRLALTSHLFSDGRWPGYVTPADLANLIIMAH